MTNQYEISDLETKRFNMNILRVKTNNLNVKELAHKIFSDSIDITFLRFPSECVENISKLDQLGFDFSQFDTLVYYYVDFNKYTPKELSNKNIHFKKAKLEDKIFLEKLVIEIFPGYTNHYNSNPFLNKNKILEGYVEWVLNFIEKENKNVFIVYKDDLPIAFATCILENYTAEGVLYGVHPDHSGGGIYSDIIRYTQKYFFEMGIKEMKVSTQIQNFAVQKVWIREGFVIKESYNTIHINSLLNYSQLKKRYYDFKFNDTKIEQYGNLSGDFNELHFSPIFAKNKGFRDKIAHGLVVSGEISRILGTDFPGSGTVFINYKNIYLKPLYCDENYKLILSTLNVKPEKGFYYCLIKVLDVKQNICLLSYNNLIKK